MLGFINGKEIDLTGASFIDENFDLNSSFEGIRKAFNKYPKNCPLGIAPSAIYAQYGFNAPDGTCIELALDLADPTHMSQKIPYPNMYIRSKGWDKWSDWRKVTFS